MNMLIIGNGFDLAHDRPTTYVDFLKFAEQIVRTKTYHSTKHQFEATMPDLHTDVRKYILSAFETRMYSGYEVTHNSNPIIQELYDCLEENIWYEYFQVIVREDKIRGKNWIDFESEIQEIIKYFDEKFDDLYEPFIIPAQERGTLSSKIRSFYLKLKFTKFNAEKCRAEDYKPTCSDFIEKTYQDLERLVRCLEIYLDDCVGKIPVICYSPDIQGVKIDSILSFNYTAIPTDIYPSLTNTHYIHGRAKANRPAAENDMVLGVNEYWEGDQKNTHTNFNPYKKFVQRIIKETGIGYKKTLSVMLSEYKDSEHLHSKTKGYIGARYNNVYIFGHSLDITDSDILKEIILTDGIVTTVFYRNKTQQTKQFANLSKMLGQNELLTRNVSTSPTIIFKKQADMKKL